MNYSDFEIVSITRVTHLRCVHCMHGICTWAHGDPTVRQIMTAVDERGPLHVCDDFDAHVPVVDCTALCVAGCN
jgi:hypothetical protein